MLTEDEICICEVLQPVCGVVEPSAVAFDAIIDPDPAARVRSAPLPAYRWWPSRTPVILDALVGGCETHHRRDLARHGVKLTRPIPTATAKFPTCTTSARRRSATR